MEASFDEIVIAAYLHDVGKFAQRADKQEFFAKELEGQFCKQHKEGWYSHQHVLYTNGFLENTKNILPDGINVQKVIQLASAHHNPSTKEEWIIAEADRLSSGSDRCNILGVSEDSSSADETKLKFYEKPMLHLLSTLNLPGNKQPEKAYCKLHPLEKDSIIATKNSKIDKSDYEKLWNQFYKDYQELSGLSTAAYLKGLNSLLERYWWCVPSATNSDVDISLYQHAKTTAAFAAVLYRYFENRNDFSLEEIRNQEDERFAFVNGDISGIQKYIFDLKTSSDSAKLLRARSFQLWAVSQVLSEHICKQFNVCDANVITSAGGKFLLLLPAVNEFEQKLNDIQLYAETYFLKEFAGKLAVIISDAVKASGKDLQQKNIGILFNKIGTAADVAKQKKMQKALAKNGFVLEDFYSDLQINGECPKCGIFPKNPKNMENGEEGECDNCNKLTDIGRKLLKGSVVKLQSEELKHFGQIVHLYRSNEKIAEDCYSINEYIPGKPLMFLPYVAPLADEDDGIVKSFAELASESEGNNKIAMFKADIDNLGLIFNTALGDRLSISRYADLSFMLHYFFSSYFAWYVHEGSDEAHRYEDVIYTVFSGGDDLCIVGSWDAVLHFAKDFQKELCKFTNNNPNITISGGISLSSGTIPVNVIAAMAEENLEKSKSFSRNGQLKNAVTVFDTTVDWTSFDSALKDGDLLENLLENQTVSQGVIYKMIDFANRAKKVKGGNIRDLLSMGDIKNRTWKSNFYYIITRNVKDETSKNKLLDFASDDEKMINSKIAVSYALYKQRKNSEEE